MKSVSLIIPTLNEAAHLERTVEAVSDHPFGEIIVSDGGSHDDTVKLAHQLRCTTIVLKDRGRARQMNSAAEIAKGEVFLFLHADTVISPETLENFFEMIGKREEIVGGSFFRSFDSSSRFLKLSGYLANLRTRFTGISLGDQGQFVTRQAFAELSGFREDLECGEDLDFSLRLRELGEVISVGPPVLTSARRFAKRGPISQTWADLRLTNQILQNRKQKL